MKFGKAIIKGIEVYVTDTRIGRTIYNKREDLFHYQIRHDDDGWGEPCTIELSVLVNHYADLVSKVSLDHLMDKNNSWRQISLDNGDIESIYNAIGEAQLTYQELYK